MRDPNRIKPFLATLERIYYIEDPEALEAIETLYRSL